MHIKDTLQLMGISGKKADIYLACLELGKATAYSVAKKTGLKRPTVYDGVSELMQKGLLYKTTKNRIVYYSPNDPAVLQQKGQEIAKRIEEAMPLLQNLYNSPSNKPMVRYFEGVEGIKEIYEDGLKCLKKGETILAFVGEGIAEYLPEYTKDYLERRVEKGILLKGIFKSGDVVNEHMKKNTQELRVAKVLPAKDFPFANEINLYKNKVAIATYGKDMFGLLIESKELYESMKAIFELTWRLMV